MSRKSKKLKASKHYQYLIRTAKKYEINDIFKFIKENNHNKQANFNDKVINTHSQRYELFMNKGIKCCKCDLKGKFFILNVGTDVNLNNPRRHFNLYGINKYGKYIMLTKDHILPKIYGGKNELCNYQVM